MCFGAKDEQFGRFQVVVDGSIQAVKLVHLSGQVTCDPHPISWSNWDVINGLPFSIYLHIFAFVMFNQDRFLRSQMIFALSYFHLISTYSYKFVCLITYYNLDLLIIYSLSSVTSCEKSKTAVSYTRTKCPLCRSFSPCFCFLPSHRLLNRVETRTRKAATLSSITHISHFLLVVWRRVTCLVTLNQLVKV